MPLTVTARYAENLPSPDTSYKTRRFEAELSTTVETEAEIPQATERLFIVAKAQVQSQIARSSADLALHQSAPTQPPPQQQSYRPQPQNQQPQQSQPFNRRPPQQPQQNRFRAASSKQVNYIQRIAKEQGYTPDQVRMIPSDFFNVQSFNDLSSDEASSIIDSLNDQRKAA